MAVFLDFERFRPPVLDRIPKSMQRSDTGISAPGKNKFSDTSGTDQLVINQIRRHTNQRQVPFALSNDFVPRRERNEMREAFECNRIAVANEFMNRLREGCGERFWCLRHFGNGAMNFI